MNADVSDNRVELLEQAVRKQRMLVYALCLLTCCAITITLLQWHNSSAMIESHKFALLDNNGDRRAEWSVKKGAPVLTFLTQDGDPGLVLSERAVTLWGVGQSISLKARGDGVALTIGAGIPRAPETISLSGNGQGGALSIVGPDSSVVLNAVSGISGVSVGKLSGPHVQIGGGSAAEVAVRGATAAGKESSVVIDADSKYSGISIRGATSLVTMGTKTLHGHVPPKQSSN